MIGTGSDYPWRDRQGNLTTVDINSLQSSNGVLRNSELITVSLEPGNYRTHESGFIDLFNVHNVYLHCPNSCHFDSISVRDESTIIKKTLYLHHSVI